MNREQIANPCPICSTTKRAYLFDILEYSINSCVGCGLMFALPVAPAHGNSNFSLSSDNINLKDLLSEDKTEFDAAEKYIRILDKLSPNIKNILLIAEPNHPFATKAKNTGFNIMQHISVDEIENDIELSQDADATVIIYQLEKSRTLDKLLNKVYEAITPGGILFLVTPSLDSQSARFFGESWVGWRPENKYYFDNTSIQLLLWRFGFQDVWLNKDIRLYTLAHINARASGLPKTWITRAIRTLYKVSPSNLHNLYFRLPSSGMIVTARKAERHEIPVLSIVIPVYNEASTFFTLMEQLLNLQLTTIQKEIIIVESNSKDSSRELVLNYKNCPEVKIVLQEKAQGKGNAVREGFEHARGDIVLIQDADLEYDLHDYDALLEPIMNFKKAFVLGSRHGGRWKMRHFNDQQQLSAYFNFGHVIFTTLINLLYSQRLKDPFTMYKVFRRDCLHNLYFECNRFDFDFELVIKLIRKGYVPFEIPVNYISRSFKEGKKVDMFRDPLTWIKASFKYKFVKITKD